MSYHIVTVDTAETAITCRNGQLVCTDSSGDSRSVPLEDVGSLVVTSFRATISNRLLVAAAKSGTSIVICDGFNPASIMLPVNRSTDSLLSRAHLALHARQRSLLWRKTVQAKIRNQHLLCAHVSPESREVAALRSLIEEDSRNAEALAARHHWRVFARAIGDESFRRGRNNGGANSLLNYGYAVLLAVVVQKLISVGLDPTFGIAHAHRERSVPLAYDLMEPFRPCVDWEVIQCVTRQGREQRFAEVDRDSRHSLSGLMVKPVKRDGRVAELRTEIEDMIRTFREAVMERKPSLYQPWTLKASKWDGCW